MATTLPGPHPLLSRPSLAIVSVLAVLASGCPTDDEKDVPSADEYFYDCRNAPAMVKIYATDESFRTIVDKEAAGGTRIDGQRSASLLAPGTGAVLSASTPPEFTLSVPSSRLPSPARPASKAAPPPGSLWRRLLRELRPVGTAHAHCGNVTGDNVLLRLVPSGQTKPVYTALLSVSMFTPGAEVWKRIMAPRKGQTLQLFLLRAVLVDGRVMDGPFQNPTVVSFTVGD